MERGERERRHRRRVLAGLAAAEAAAAVLAVVVGFLVSTQGNEHGPLPVRAPEPTPAPPPVVVELPGQRDLPIAVAEIRGALLVATLRRLDRPGTATLWHRAAGGWQRVGSLEDAVPRHLDRDSAGTYLSPGPGRLDLVARTSDSAGLRFSRDGGATWTRLAPPAGCGGCYVVLHGDRFYARRPDHFTTLARVAFGATAWEERAIPAGAGPERGYGALVALADGTLVVEEAGGCVAGARGHYRVSRDHGETWSGRRALPGSSNCLAGAVGGTLHAHCNTTGCYYDTGGDGGGEGTYASTDLRHWEPLLEPPSPDPPACPRGRGRDGVYRWVDEAPVRVGNEVAKLFHLTRNGREHVLKVSRDECRTWQRVLP